MLIVRGVNVFPSALRSVLNDFSPDVSGVIQVRPQRNRGEADTAAAGSG